MVVGRGGELRILTFDLELLEAPDGSPEGWARARRGELGMSVCAVWDSEAGRPFLYGQKEIKELVAHLNRADRLVGFNSLEFDIPIIQSLAQSEIACRDHYDILQHVWNSLGTRKKGWKLNDIAKRTIGMEKDGKGAAAPALWKAGKHFEVINYCVGDVHLTRELYNHIVDVGHVLGPDDHALWLEQPDGDYA